MKPAKVLVVVVMVALLVWAGVAGHGRQGQVTATTPVSETPSGAQKVDTAPVEYLTAAVVGTQARISTFVSRTGGVTRICDFVVDTYPGQCDAHDSLVLSQADVEQIVDDPQIAGDLFSGEATMTVVKVDDDTVRYVGS